MRWSVVVAGRPPRDLEAICRAARTDTIVPFESIGPDSGPESGIVVVGTDATLAAVADRIAPATGPLALVPTIRSDLLRMFGLTRRGVITRLHSGSPYRVDLGYVVHRGARHPFAAHAVAFGPRPPWMSRREPVTVITDRRDVRLRAWRVIAANAQHVGDWALAPRAALTDGLIDVQVLGGNVLQRGTLRRRARRGLHLGQPTVWRRSLQAAMLELPSDWLVSTDGMPVGLGTFSVEVRAAAFDLWI